MRIAARRSCHAGDMTVNPIALWLRKEVGLTSYDVQTRFGPFARRALDTGPKTNPHAYFTKHTMPETYPSPTDDSLRTLGKTSGGLLPMGLTILLLDRRPLRLKRNV